MDNQIKVPPALIKVGRKKDLLKLQQNGEVYFGTFSKYRMQEKTEMIKMFQDLLENKQINIDEIDHYRRDATEGREKVIPAEITVRFLHEKLNNLTIHDPNGKINIFQNKYEHLYCLYGIPNNLDTNFQIDSKMLKFGEHALIITDPLTFLKRCVEKLTGNYTLGSVEYYSEEKENYTIFQKKDFFQYQNEFRIAANIENGNSILIGNIEDISTLVQSKTLMEIEYTME